VRLYRPATVLVGILFVLLGGVARLGEPDHVYDKTSREVVHGTVGQELRYGDSTVTVSRVKFAKTFLAHADDSAEKAVTTEGVFVAVEYDASRGPAHPDGNEVSLTADGGTEYHPVSEGINTGIMFPANGFAQSGSFVFEVNPSDLVGLTFHVTTIQFWTVLTQDLAFDLAIPSEEIAQRQVDGAGKEYLMPKSVTRVAS
jgi:hypothetical protein